MLARAFGAHAPPDLSRTAGRGEAARAAITELRRDGMTEQRSLEQIEQRGRDGRQRFGFAVDALGIDASAARDLARTAGELLPPLQNETKACADALLAHHRQIINWEGRSAFHEPYAELAHAYRGAANIVDGWLAAKQKQRAAQSALDERDRVVADIEYQIQELRGALARFEHSIEAEKTAQENRIGDLGRRADAMDSELVSLASRFCAPLRSRPELSPFFKELEGAVAA